MQWCLPELGEGVLEAELVAWLVKPGDSVRVGQGLAEVLTDKASVELPSPLAGTILELLVAPGDILPVGSAMAQVEPAESSKGSKTNALPADPSSDLSAAALSKNDASNDSLSSASRPVAAPSLRRRARELGIDLRTIQGTGSGGRILEVDLAQHQQQPNPPSATSSSCDTATTKNSPGSAAAEQAMQPGSRIPLRGIRRKIAQQMVRSKNTIPHYTYIDQCDVTELVKLRESLKADYAERGAKLTYLAILLKATAMALREVPVVNASLEEESDEIVLHDRYDLGIAVATDSGLLVPVIRNVDQRSLFEVAAEIQRLSEEARQGKSRREDLCNGTFTVTSIGNIGGLISTPIINHPEVGILGAGKIVRQPQYDAEGKIYPADLLYLSFSFDHRVIDGAIGAQFGNAVMRELSNPSRWLTPEDHRP